MNDPIAKRRTQIRALKDAMVAQVLALTDEEVAQEAQREGGGLRSAQARVKAICMRAANVAVGGTNDKVVTLESTRPPATNQQFAGRHRLVRTTRLAASVDPPSDPRATDTKKHDDRPGSTVDDDSDRPKD